VYVPTRPVRKEPRRAPRSLRQIFSAVFANSAVSSSP
jgi:hypothetical protein